MDYSWRAANNNCLIPKTLPSPYYQGCRFLITSYLKYLVIVVFHFDAMLCSKLGNEISDAGHIKCCVVGRRFPTSALKDLLPCLHDTRTVNLALLWGLPKEEKHSKTAGNQVYM